jgi:predicted Rossmann fold nucleotide-binding protein DprA/Smf involved in DNA uptake
MARNKLVCALSSALIVISSGKELDSKGRMSGTFDAAKTAMKMNIPVFVFSPDSFIKMPEGNRDLIKLGGYEITKNNAVNLIVSTLKNNCVSSLKEKEQTVMQLELFSSIS